MKNLAPWAGVAVAILAAAISYGALTQRVDAAEQRMTRIESQREKDSAEIQTIRIIVTRMCAVTPGCRE